MMQDKKSLYKAALMDHFKNPRHKYSQPFPEDMSTARGSIPRCGDDIEVGMALTSSDLGQDVDKVGFRGRGCSVCLASASMMTEALLHMDSHQAYELIKLMGEWVDNKLENPEELPENIEPLAAVKDHPARKKCVMLAWNAAQDAIQKAWDKES